MKKKELEDKKHDKSDKYNKDIALQGGKIEMSNAIQSALKNLKPLERKKIEQHIMEQLTTEQNELSSLRNQIKKNKMTKFKDKKNNLTKNEQNL